MKLALTRIYARLVIGIRRRVGWCPPGLGRLLRSFRSEHVLEIEGRKFLFNQHGASMYGEMILERYAEPETHLFLRAVLRAVKGEVRFTDVGAAIGEMAIDVAGYENVREVLAVDPDEDNVRAIEGSARLNGFSNLHAIQAAVSNEVGLISFKLNKGRGSSGHMAGKEVSGTERIRALTLDSLFAERPKEDSLQELLLIDVEGAEVKVLEGGSAFIRERLPLMTFDYNLKSKQYFCLDDVRAVLGPDYQIYRLRPDGRLDSSFEDTWNCVGVPRRSHFQDICHGLRAF